MLVLTTYSDDSDVLAAIDAGATGYLLKDAPREELLRGVRAAARGESVLSPSVAATLLGRVRAPQREAPLSPRELEVLQLIARGATNREAAKQLFISEATVKTHLHPRVREARRQRPRRGGRRGLRAAVCSGGPRPNARLCRGGPPPYVRERPMSFSATGSLHL